MLGQGQETLASPGDSSAVPVLEHEESHNSEGGHDAHFHGLTKRQAYCLFVSHTLSVWSSRMYEFGVVKVFKCFFVARKPSLVGRW